MKRINFEVKAIWIVKVFAILITYHISLVTSDAQPRQHRSQQQATQQQATQQQGQQQAGVTQRMRTQYPTALDMPEDVVWRRDIYREIDLNEEPNAGLYDPVEPQGRRMNLFTYVFKLALGGYINVYEYNLDGNEVLEPQAKVEMRTILDNYQIYYTEENGRLRVENSDIPSPEVKMYYLKECAYYDQANASFRIKPIAFCPVMMREDDFGGEAARYPLFWVKYSEVEPYLSRQTIKTSDVNDAAQMTLDDYFTLNRYHGRIYKTANRLGRTLSQIAGGDTARYSAEQRRIEAELEAFRNNIFGDKARRDSLDSVATAQPANNRKAARQQRQRDRSARASSRRDNDSGGSSGGSQPARVSVRRQRH